LFGLSGGEFHIGGAVNFGTSISANYIGNSFPVQLADVAATQPRLTYLSYTQLLDEGKVSFRIGRLTVNSVTDEEFMGSEYFKLLCSVGFDLIPQGLFFDANGAPGYPHTTWGTRLKYTFSDRVYLQAGVYNGDVKQRSGDLYGMDFSLRGPLFTIAELGLGWNSRAQDTGLARNLKFGGYYNGGTYTQAEPQRIRNVNGLYGLYFVGDQELWRWHDSKGGQATHSENRRYADTQRDRHLGIFGAFTAEPQARLNAVPYFFDAGVAAYGPSAERPRDFAAVGIVYGSFKNTPQGLLAATPLITPSSNEETLEATYGFVVRPGLLFQPSLQWIIHPRGNISISSALPPGSSVPNARAIGVNIVVNF
jgi:porin